MKYIPTFDSFLNEDSGGLKVYQIDAIGPVQVDLSKYPCKLSNKNKIPRSFCEWYAVFCTIFAEHGYVHKDENFETTEMALYYPINDKIKLSLHSTYTNDRLDLVVCIKQDSGKFLRDHSARPAELQKILQMK